MWGGGKRKRKGLGNEDERWRGRDISGSGGIEENRRV